MDEISRAASIMGKRANALMSPVKKRTICAKAGRATWAGVSLKKRSEHMKWVAAQRKRK